MMTPTTIRLAGTDRAARVRLADRTGGAPAGTSAGPGGSGWGISILAAMTHLLRRRRGGRASTIPALPFFTRYPGCPVAKRHVLSRPGRRAAEGGVRRPVDRRRPTPARASGYPG